MKLLLDITKEQYIAAYTFNNEEGFESLEDLATVLKIGSKSEAMEFITEAWSNEDNLLDQLEFIDSSTEIVEITESASEEEEAY